MLFQPLLQSLPTILGCFRVKAWALVCMKTMLGLIINTDFRDRSTGLQSSIHSIHTVQRDSSIFSCIRSQDGAIKLVYKINWILRFQLTRFSLQLTTSSHTRPNEWIVRRVQPSNPTTPAEASDPHLGSITMIQTSPGCCCIQITHHPGIRYFRGHFANDSR